MTKKLVAFTMFIVLALSARAQEICNNAIDDDGNGLVDLNDPQCACNESISGNPVSLFPNPSFEDTICCPNWLGQVSCATPWQQISYVGSADYFHTCNFLPASIPAAGLFPFPDGDACMGILALSDYSEYIGACLPSTMLAGTAYTVQMDIAMLEVTMSLGSCPEAPIDYTPLALTVFGAPSCGNFPLGVLACPSAPFVPVGTLTYDPLGSWQTVSFTFTPTFDVAEVAIGASCILPPDYPAFDAPCYPYILIDNLIANTSASFSPFNIELSGSLCNHNAVLDVSPVLTGGTWQWYQDGVAIVGQTDPTLNISTLNLNGGNYTVTFNGAAGCASDSLNVADIQPISIAVNSDTICEGSSTLLNVTGIADSCTWSPAAGLSSTSGFSVQASPAETTSYTVTAWVNGCSATAVATVTVTPEIILDVMDGTTCAGGSATLTATGASSYTWSPVAGLNTTTGSSVIATVNTTTSYLVTGFSGDCSATAYATVTIENNIPMSVSASPNPVTADNPLVSFQGEPSGEQLSWNFGDNTSGTGPHVTHQYLGVGETYEVWMVVTTAEGCIDSMSVTVIVKSGLIFYVPNAFTPDGDEHNNLFLPVFSSGFDPFDYELTIYNRWGEIVFLTNNVSEGWDASYNGRYVPDGEYTWKIFVKSDETSERGQFDGHVNVLR